jgi:hypothetical protein
MLRNEKDPVLRVVEFSGEVRVPSFSSHTSTV